MKHKTENYIHISGPNNVTISGNIISMHTMCRDFGAPFVISRQEICIPQDGIEQIYIYYDSPFCVRQQCLDQAPKCRTELLHHANDRTITWIESLGKHYSEQQRFQRHPSDDSL